MYITPLIFLRSRSRRALSESAVHDEHQGRIVEATVCGEVDTDDESVCDDRGPIREQPTGFCSFFNNGMPF